VPRFTPLTREDVGNNPPSRRSILLRKGSKKPVNIIGYISDMEILAQIGIDGKLLLAQAVNFLVLLFILHRFAYKPMLAFLEKRTERIEEGLKNAEEAKKRLDEASRDEERILATAREEAKKIVTETREASEKRGQELVAEFERKAERIVEEAQERAKEEREKMFREAKGEIADLVIATTEKVLREKLDGDAERGKVTKYLGEAGNPE